MALYCRSAVVAILVLLHAAPAGAQTTVADPEQLFEEARGLMAQGRFAEACAKLEGSEAQDPGIGTEFNLARCYELAGRLASARAMYRRVIEETQAAGQKDRETLARDLYAQLQPRVAHLALHVASLSSPLEVHLDGVLVPTSEWATPLEVDTGTHEVQVSASSFLSWKTLVRIVRDGETVSLEVPPLVPRAAVESIASPAPLTIPARPVSSEAPTRGAGPQRILAVALGAVGLVGLVPGTYFGAQAISLESRAEPLCQPLGCNSDGYSLRTSSRWNGDASTVTFLLSGALLAAAGVVWFTATH